MEADPNSSTVCLSDRGIRFDRTVRDHKRPKPAVLYFAYRPGATYVVKGQGCASINVPPYTLCQDFPPSRFTL